MSVKTVVLFVEDSCTAIIRINSAGLKKFHGILTFMSDMRLKFTSIALISIFMFVYFLYAISTFRSYGITWDETDVYTSGRMTWTHLVTRRALDEPQLMTKTPGSEIRAVYDSSYATVLFGLNRGESYERYHLLNMLFNGLIFVSAYIMLVVWCRNPWLALLGPIMLVLTPRFWGDFPANPKDTPFATMYFVGLTAIYLSPYVRNMYVRIVVYACVIGAVQSFRIVGLTLFPLLFVYELYLYLDAHQKNLKWKSFVRWLCSTGMRLGITVFCALFITVLGWPYLGSSFLKHLTDILKTSREYPWFGVTLTHGVNMKSDALPWNYLVYWYGVTTPIIVLVLSIVAVVKGFTTNFRNPIYFLLTCALVLNISMIALSHPHMYDGLRHSMFLLPILTLLATTAFIELVQSLRGKWLYICIVLVLCNGALVAREYVRLHPYEYIYFNELVGGLPGAQGRYETDYWGASFREAVLWLRDETKNSREKIVVHTCAHPFISQYYFGDHMTWTPDTKKADYSICYTRNHEDKDIVGDIIHVVSREGVALNYVKKNNSR